MINNNTLTSMSCSDFATALAAKQSVPGGGAAAAYAGALSAALGEMVANFTLGNKRYEQVESEVQRILSSLENARARLLSLCDEDAASFAPLMDAYALPKDDPSRAALIEERTAVAMQAPLEMMKQVCSVIECCEELLDKGNKMLLSDVGCATSLARSALESAAINVLVNTKSMTNRSVAGEINETCEQMLSEYIDRAQKATDAVIGLLR